MSLGIAFKGAGGIILAADSRITLTAAASMAWPGLPPQLMALPSIYDNATKLLRMKEQKYHEAALLTKVPFRNSLLRRRDTLPPGTASPAGKA